MKLAISELKFYKFRYALILFIVILLASMVLFITGLAQGLARENVSMLDGFKAEQYVIQKDAEEVLEKSRFSPATQKEIEGVITDKPVEIAKVSTQFDNTKEDMLFVNLPDNERPKLKEGHYPQSAQEVVLNSKVAAKGVKVGDKINIQEQNQKLQVVGFFEHTMHSHANVALMTEQGLKQVAAQHVATALYPLHDVSDSQIHDLEHIDGIEVTTKDALKAAIPSYQAEQMPLNMMVISLFVITAIVLTAFFYVMTIQKTSEIGILKAVGVKTIHLLSALIFQILFVTMLGVLIGIGIVITLSMFLPGTMPFVVTPMIIVLTIVIFIIVALVGALLSFIRVYKIDPIEAIGGGFA
ncbi:ABC transporter permease [Staphylococcus americanisciuri]|uniref:Putative hemin transport system permease protein HrtB n=1 Tax=Staphylococcus americanisciuri TaxID=2973940 RepID=A0ABT2F0Y3_9STAP|nr:ABC transporter permease [Staphylococcus americanisciuri]MCS4486097.1 ABC transporter permease [Staphylococcus americanisciuri]